MTGDKVKQARKQLGLTQAQLAQVMGLTGKTYISKIENNTQPLGEVSIRLLKAYLAGYRPEDWPNQD
jgi:transcriptional regulator with XRE-family HTH domain